MLEFWDLTPRETVTAIEAGTERIQAERELAMSVAWHVAALQRAKRLPSLAGLLARIKPRRDVPIEKRREEFEELKGRIENIELGKERMGKERMGKERMGKERIGKERNGR